jgi:hypothetical protein
MRTDPRVACGNEKELVFWAFVHDAIAHPLMALTGWSKFSLRFHDYTSHYAWPRDKRTPARPVTVRSDRFGDLTVTTTPAGFFEVAHGRIAHRLCVRATDVSDAVEQAEQWFSGLVELIPESATN